MVLPFPRRSWFLSAIVVVALAPSSRAADSGSGQAPQPSSPIEDLKSGDARPEDFQRLVEGSRAMSGNIELPGVSVKSEGRGPNARARLSPAQTGLRPDGTSVPAAPSAAAAVRKARLHSGAGTTDLPVRKLAAVLGLGFFLIAASMMETPAEYSVGPEMLQEIPALRALPSAVARASEPALAPTRFANALTEPSFIDTRMPVPTWRAISLREQQLIERWDASREKALGLASLPEWLDGMAPVEGVNLPLFKAKLHREA
jgi:hypothetical protein